MDTLAARPAWRRQRVHPCPKPASGRATFCHTHDRTSAQVSPTDYDARSCRSRFLTRDPLEVLTREPYQYASNDPINRTDPTGMWPHVAIAGAIGGIVGGVAGGVQHVVDNGLSDPRGVVGSVAGGAVNGAVVGSCSVATGRLFECGAAGAVAGGYVNSAISGDSFTWRDAAAQAVLGGTINWGVGRVSPWPIGRGWFQPRNPSHLWNPGPYASRIYKNEALNSLFGLGSAEFMRWLDENC